VAVGSAAAFTLPALAGPAGAATAAPTPAVATPIHHVVVIYQENVSFDHYFGTYPHAANTDGQTFTAKTGTPAVNGLSTAVTGGTLLDHNPNSANPRRYANTVTGNLTCDQNHDYADEQKAFDGGKMDRFVDSVGTPSGTSATKAPCDAADVMNYYDGNTVTGLWNYAQRYAMSDASFGTTFGPSSPGAINLISGDTGGVDRTARAPAVATAASPNGEITPDGTGGYSMIGDPQPYFDDCSSRDSVSMKGLNVGDKLNAAGLSWGFFQGGFRATAAYSGPSGGTPASYDPTTVTGRAACAATHNVGVSLGAPAGRTDLGTAVGPYGTKGDYIAHHQPFQYYASTANPHHVAPASNAVIGTDTSSPGLFDKANHQYDMSDFDSLVSDIGHGTLSADHLPAVSFLKAPGYEDGHAGYSDPVDEQNFITREVNALQQTPDWASTAVIVAYDDSDGWYDHVYGGVENPSSSVSDLLTSTGKCGTGTPLGGQQGRCGYGPRMPLLVISPWAKTNFVDHTTTDQSSITKFVEDNWGLGRINGSFDSLAGPLNSLFDFSNPSAAPNAATLYLDPRTGKPVAAPVPVVPESPYPVLLGISAVGLGAAVRGRRRLPLGS